MKSKKKITLNNDGTVVSTRRNKSLPQSSKPSREPVQVKEEVTTDFLRQIKSELLQELVELLVKAGLRTVKNKLSPLTEESEEKEVNKKPNALKHLKKVD